MMIQAISPLRSAPRATSAGSAQPMRQATPQFGLAYRDEHDRKMNGVLPLLIMPGFPIGLGLTAVCGQFGQKFSELFAMGFTQDQSTFLGCVVGGVLGALSAVGVAEAMTEPVPPKTSKEPPQAGPDMTSTVTAEVKPLKSIQPSYQMADFDNTHGPL